MWGKEIDSAMIPHQDSSTYQNSRPYFTNSSLNPNSNTTTTPSPLNPSLSPNITTTTTTKKTTTTAAIVGNTPTNSNVVESEITGNVANRSYYYVGNYMNPPHGSSGFYDSPSYSRSPFFKPHDSTITNTTPTAAYVVGMEINASTSYGANNNNNNNNNMNPYGDLELPPGYKFCPTDDELIRYYLERRIKNEKLPHDKIHNLILYDTTPEKLSQEYEPVEKNEWYFFTPRDRKYKNGERPNRAAGTSLGYWKATGAEKSIHHRHKPGEVIGHKRSLVFHLGKDRKNGGKTKTNWIMQEFRLETSCKRKRLHDDDMELDLVLCKVYYNKNDKGPKGSMKLEIGDEARRTQSESEVVDNTRLVDYKTVFNTNELDYTLNNYNLQDYEDAGIEMQLQAAMYGSYHSNHYLQGFHNPQIEPGYYQGESSVEQAFYHETNSVMNPSSEQGFYDPKGKAIMKEYAHFQRETPADQSLTQLTSMISLDKNEELGYNNSIAPSNNPSSDAPPSQMDCID